MQHAHELASGLPPVDKAEVLTRVVTVAGLRPFTGVDAWIDELFGLGAQLGELDRDGPEAAAAEAMAHSSPQEALEMLDRIQEPHLQPDQPYRDARAQAAPTVFEAALAQQGAATLPQLRERAQRMGSSGQYPYMVWARLLPLVQAKAGPDFIREVFEDSVTAYLGSVPNGSAEEDFRHFFAATWRSVPYEVAHSAAERTVERLRGQAAERREGTHVLRIFTATGEAEFSNPGQVRLLTFVNGVLAAIDPGMADAVRKSDPVLTQAALRSGAGDTMVPEEVSEADRRAYPDMPTQRSQAMVRANYLANRDMGAAIAYAKGIADPLTRSEAYASIVTTMAGSGKTLDKDAAKALVAQAEASAESVTDVPGRLLAFGHVAQAAAAIKDDDAVMRAVDAGLPLGSALLNDAKARDPVKRAVVVFWLEQMVTDLARIDQQSALRDAERIGDSKLRALLLVDLAEHWKE